MSIELFSLGKLYPSDFLKPNEQPRSEPVELKLVMEDNGLVHLEKTADKEVMWGKYFYKSGTNSSMTNQLKDVVDSILPLMNFKSGQIWLDAACNDGTLLSFVPETFCRIGIDPAEDKYRQQAEIHSDLIIQDYFSSEVFKKSIYGKQKVKVFTSIAVFYDVENPDKFIQDVYEILEDDGLWVMQVSYSALGCMQNAIDNCVHEHFGYYNLYTLYNLLYDNGFSVIDCQMNDTNGGSIRLYIMKRNKNIYNFGTQAYRDVCSFRVQSLLQFESYAGFNESEVWANMFNRVNKLKTELLTFIKTEKEKGNTFYGYAASTKANTVLQYFGLNSSMINFIADRNPEKWGLRCVGSNIPICSEEDFRKFDPDYCIVFAWHFIGEFMQREREYLLNGGKFITLMPSFRIITKADL